MEVVKREGEEYDPDEDGAASSSVAAGQEGGDGATAALEGGTLGIKVELALV